MELTNFVSSKLFDKTNTQDIMQEIAIKIYKNLDKLQNIDNVRAWLYRVTRNTLIDFYKLNSKKIPDEIYNIEFSVVEAKEKNDVIQCINYLSRQLNQSDAQILDLSINEQYSINEIASKLNLSKDGVKSKLKRAKQKVANKLFSCCSLEKDSMGKILDINNLTDNKCKC